MFEIITKEKFMKLYEQASAVDYAGEYMSIMDDAKFFVFLSNCSKSRDVRFPLSVADGGVEVNRFGDMFRFKTDDCEWFGLLSTIKVSA